jgi:CMP-N-acetylneuraminic acid synthetase
VSADDPRANADAVARGSGSRSVLGLIPARGGSKGLPGKNTTLLAGKPLIAWTIEAALGAASIDDVVVTTDSDEIARVSAEAGASVPFMRPARFARDDTPMVDTVLHALDELEAQGRTYGSVALLQPTSPLRQAHHIDEAAELRSERGCEAVVSVSEMEHSPLWANTLPADGRMGDFLRPGLEASRRQELPTHYRLNGAIYLIETDTLRRERAFIGPFAVAYVMPPEVSVDVDDALDLAFAEFLLMAARARP